MRYLIALALLSVPGVALAADPVSPPKSGPKFAEPFAPPPCAACAAPKLFSGSMSKPAVALAHGVLSFPGHAFEVVQSKRPVRAFLSRLRPGVVFPK